jgi:hypothetical protein
MKSVLPLLYQHGQGRERLGTRGIFSKVKEAIAFVRLCLLLTIPMAGIHFSDYFIPNL